MAEILLADDERMMRDGLKALLAGEGFAVRTARDGADALVRFSEKCSLRYKTTCARALFFCFSSVILIFDVYSSRIA